MRVSPDIKVYFEGKNPLARYVRPLKQGLCASLNYFFYRVWNAIKAIFNRSDWQIIKKNLYKQVKQVMINADYLPQLERRKSAQLWTEVILSLAIDKKCADPFKAVNNLDDRLRGDIGVQEYADKKECASTWAETASDESSPDVNDSLSKSTLLCYRKALQHHLFYNLRQPMKIDHWKVKENAYKNFPSDLSIEKNMRKTNFKIKEVIARATGDEFFSRDPFAYMKMWSRNIASEHSYIWKSNPEFAKKAYAFVSEQLESLSP